LIKTVNLVCPRITRNNVTYCIDLSDCIKQLPESLSCVGCSTPDPASSSPIVFYTFVYACVCVCVLLRERVCVCVSYSETQQKSGL